MTSQGFSNALLDDDGKIRLAMLEAEYQQQTYPSFVYEVATIYCKQTGRTLTRPKTDAYGRFGFKYTSQVNGYEKFSLIDVLQGEVDERLFQDCIVLVGAYSTGMMDQYYVPITDQQMYGVEIQANIIEALLDEATLHLLEEVNTTSLPIEESVENPTMSLTPHTSLANKYVSMYNVSKGGYEVYRSEDLLSIPAEHLMSENEKIEILEAQGYDMNSSLIHAQGEEITQTMDGKIIFVGIILSIGGLLGYLYKKRQHLLN